VFCALDQILAEASGQCQGADRLAQAAMRADLGCLCDVKEAGGDTYYRLNDKKVGSSVYMCVYVKEEGTPTSG